MKATLAVIGTMFSLATCNPLGWLVVGTVSASQAVKNRHEPLPTDGMGFVSKFLLMFTGTSLAAGLVIATNDLCFIDCTITNEQAFMATSCFGAMMVGFVGFVLSIRKRTESTAQQVQPVQTVVPVVQKIVPTPVAQPVELEEKSIEQEPQGIYWITLNLETMEVVSR